MYIYYPLTYNNLIYWENEAERPEDEDCQSHQDDETYGNNNRDSSIQVITQTQLW